MKVRYIANITAGALLVSESRKIADLMIREVSVEEWKDAIENKNILQRLIFAGCSLLIIGFSMKNWSGRSPDL